MAPFTDPVIDPEGHTYERSAIIEWLQTKPYSPITRTPLSADQLVPNRALSPDGTPTPPAPPSTLATPIPIAPLQLSVLAAPTSTPNEYLAKITVISPEPPARAPADVVLVVDISGSMGSATEISTASGEKESHGLSYLDIVKHASRMVMRSLGDNDRLSLVSFTTTAKVEYPLKPMTAANRKAAETALDKLEPEATTNIWDGVSKALDVLRDAEPDETNVRARSVLLLTDGVPNVVPPRGHEAMLERYFDQHGRVATLSTFGFGYSLDSALLDNLATIGRGAYAFIPDASFVGAAFSHAASNLLATVAVDTELCLEVATGVTIVSEESSDDAETDLLKAHAHSRTTWGASVGVGSVIAEQSRDVILRLRTDGAEGGELLSAVLKYTSCGERAPQKAAEANLTIPPPTPPPSADGSLYRERLRQLFVLRTRAAIAGLTSRPRTDVMLKGVADGPVAKLIAECKEALAGSASGPALGAIESLATDAKGQLSEAVSCDKFYDKWGEHYLRSLAGAHAQQWRNNFKDASVQHYGEGGLVTGLRDAADACFVAMPPPKPSARSSYRGGHAAGPPPSMAAYMNRGAPCIAGECAVRMAGGGTLLASELKKGSKVAMGTGRQGESLGEATVRCVVATTCEQGVNELVPIGKLRITPYHPVRVNGESWAFPIEVAGADKCVEQPCPKVYSYVLDTDSVGTGMMVEGIAVIGMGNGFANDEAVGGCAAHAFFGSTTAVRGCLSKLRGWDAGLVELMADCAVRDPVTGLVCGLRQ